MNLIYKIFRQNPNSREGIITTVSSIGISANIFIAAVKIVLGLLVSSVAIISEGANNATDALSSILTLLGTKLAGKHPDKKHPFGYRRIEYLTGVVISLVIIVAGIEMLISSVKLIFNPESLNVSYLSVIIIAVSAIIKFLLGVYTEKMGKKTDSHALEATGKESKSDSFASAITIISSLIFIFSGLSLDAYAGIIISAIILKAGFDVLKETLSEIIGRPGEEKLASELYKEIRNTDGIIDAADMMLHNYGPDTWSGSVNLEIDHKKTVGEIYMFLHSLQLKIMRKYGVVMVFGIYAVDNDDERNKELRKYISSFINENIHIKSFHAVYFEFETNKIYCDLVVDYELKDWQNLRSEFLKYMKKNYPENEIELTIETEYV